MTANMMPALQPRQAEHPELPYVFDTRVHVKQTAAYILGAKITLPVDVVNDSKPGYEEYTFPATKQVPPEWTDNFVDISQLDDVGRIAFKGIKKVRWACSAARAYAELDCCRQNASCHYYCW